MTFSYAVSGQNVDFTRGIKQSAKADVDTATLEKCGLSQIYSWYNKLNVLGQNRILENNKKKHLQLVP